MNFLADENVDRQIVDRLRQDGHILRYVIEMEARISDDTVLDLANKESCLLITPSHKAEIVSSAINKYKSQLPHAFSVITPGAIRIRQRSLWGGIWRMHRRSTFG